MMDATIENSIGTNASLGSNVCLSYVSSPGFKAGDMIAAKLFGTVVTVSRCPRY